MSKQQKYRVRVEIDVDGETAEQAAQEAYRLLRFPDCIPWYCEVKAPDGTVMPIDLSEQQQPEAQLVIEVRKGVVEEVYSNFGAEIVLVDYDRRGDADAASLVAISPLSQMSRETAQCVAEVLGIDAPELQLRRYCVEAYEKFLMHTRYEVEAENSTAAEQLCRQRPRRLRPRLVPFASRRILVLGL